MHSDVMAFYGFYRDFDDVDDFEAAHHQSLLQALETAVDTGALIALTGEVGSGKTRLLHRLQTRLQHERGLHTAWSRVNSNKGT
jgi:type II secretory pathway predicted ATPase ExeA